MYVDFIIVLREEKIFMPYLYCVLVMNQSIREGGDCPKGTVSNVLALSLLWILWKTSIVAQERRIVVLQSSSKQ